MPPPEPFSEDWLNSAFRRHQKRPNQIVEIFRRRRGRGRKNPDAGGVTVDPNTPRDLSGGASAALDFDQ
jgi:hypothetical protein